MKRSFRAGLFLIPALIAVLLSACTDSANPRLSGHGNDQPAGTPLTRLLFQDHKTCALKWTDVRISDKGQNCPCD
jgi:hypothetical protein